MLPSPLRSTPLGPLATQVQCSPPKQFSGSAHGYTYADERNKQQTNTIMKTRTLSNVSGVSYSRPPWSRNPQLLESSRSSLARNSTSGWSSSTDMANDDVTQPEKPPGDVSQSPARSGREERGSGMHRMRDSAGGGCGKSGRSSWKDASYRITRRD